MPEDAHAARRAAVALLDAVLGEGRMLSEAESRLDRLPPETRATARRLAQDTLRALERADRVLARHMRKPPPLTARNALRLATVEICTGGAAHGAVNGAVEIVAGAGRRTAPAKGMVNAVLRKLAETGPAEWQKLRVPHLPKWLRKPLVQAWGAEAVAAMEAAHFAGAPLDLTARDDPAALAEATGGTLLPTGSVRLHGPAQVSALPGFAEGRFWVQDAAAALPAKLLAPAPGETVLDLCAAPGGKTLQLAAMGAEVTAVDASGPRLGRVAENLARTGLSATLVEGDALAQQGQWPAILLDAPCSATGTIRRHPELPHTRDGTGIDALIDLQARLLDHAIGLLAPGGRLVYCTCSLIPDEGEVQVEEALARHSGLSVAPPQAPWVESGWRTAEGGVRLRPDFWPERGGMDGFYLAVLHKD